MLLIILSYAFYNDSLLLLCFVVVVFRQGRTVSFIRFNGETARNLDVHGSFFSEEENIITRTSVVH